MKKFCIVVFIIIHIIITRFAIRIIDATVQNDRDYIYIILVAAFINAGLYFVFKKLYKRMFCRK